VDAGSVDAGAPDAALPVQTATLVAARDTQLYSPDPTFNYGNFAEVVCAASPTLDSPVLFGFDLGSLPPGAIVESAILRLTTANNALTAGQVAVFALLEQWAEGSQNGAPGAASYNERLPGVPWSAAGAMPPSRAGVAAASFAATSTMTAFEVPLPVALVQGWVDTPAANFGVILTCPSGQDAAFYARGSTASRQPRLVVSYR
jgi:hypothetical protein